MGTTLPRDSLSRPVGISSDGGGWVGGGVGGWHVRDGVGLLARALTVSRSAPQGDIRVRDGVRRGEGKKARGLDSGGG